MDWTHFPRWFTASIAYHFEDQDICDTFIETDCKDINKLNQYMEVRVDGPYRRTISKGLYELECPVNVLVSAKQNEDVYNIHRLLGKVYNSFITIPVFRYGEGTGDDESNIGCLNLISDQPLILSYLGKIENELFQGYVQGRYRMELQE